MYLGTTSSPFSVCVHSRNYVSTLVFAKYWNRICLLTNCDVTNPACRPASYKHFTLWVMNVKIAISCQTLLICHSTQWRSDIQLEEQEEKHILTRDINTRASKLYFYVRFQSGWLSLFHQTGCFYGHLLGFLFFHLILITSIWLLWSVSLLQYVHCLQTLNV